MYYTSYSLPVTHAKLPPYVYLLINSTYMQSYTYVLFSPLCHIGTFSKSACSLAKIWADFSSPSDPRLLPAAAAAGLLLLLLLGVGKVATEEILLLLWLEWSGLW